MSIDSSAQPYSERDSRSGLTGKHSTYPRVNQEPAGLILALSFSL